MHRKSFKAVEKRISQDLFCVPILCLDNILSTQKPIPLYTDYWLGRHTYDKMDNTKLS